MGGSLEALTTSIEVLGKIIANSRTCYRPAEFFGKLLLILCNRAVDSRTDVRHFVCGFHKTRVSHVKKLECFRNVASVP